MQEKCLLSISNGNMFIFGNNEGKLERMIAITKPEEDTF